MNFIKMLDKIILQKTSSKSIFSPDCKSLLCKHLTE